MTPTPRVRPIQMRFLVSRSSYSSDAAGENVDELLDPLVPAARRLERQPADAEVAGHHPLPREHLEDAQNILALAEAVEEHAHGADIQRGAFPAHTRWLFSRVSS